MAIEPGVWRVPQRERRRHVAADAGEFIRELDYVLLAAVAAVVGYGLWIVQTVTADDAPGDPDRFVVRQGIYVAIGALALAAAVAVGPELLRRYRGILFAGAIALMVVVFVVGSSTRGSRRWIDFGSFQLQPSEIGKIALVVFLAGFLAERGRRIDSAGPVLAVVGLASVPILLVFFEPDFGTALVMCSGAAAVLYIAGARWLHLAILALAAAGLAVAVLWALPSAGFQVLKPYQVDRLIGFIHPDSDPAGTTYNINQSVTAVGAGGVDGRGSGGATQTNLDFLPEHATDFIFASLAEQRGFLGAAVLLLLYALIVWRGIRIVAVADSLFAAIVAGAIVSALLFQVFLNVGMTIGVAPITGIPLPFVSYGGSSMITSLVMIGILQAIRVRGRLSSPR
jgi:rod shape determining protein RodA